MAREADTIAAAIQGQQVEYCLVESVPSLRYFEGRMAQLLVAKESEIVLATGLVENRELSQEGRGRSVVLLVTRDSLPSIIAAMYWIGRRDRVQRGLS